MDAANHLAQALDVAPASAAGELFSVNTCNYTGLTARGPWRLRSAEMRPKGWCRGIAGSLWRTRSRNNSLAAPTLLHTPPCLTPHFSSVSSFPPVSGWRQAGPPGAFKSLLGVRGREAGPSIPNRCQSPEASARNHSFSGCQPA